MRLSPPRFLALAGVMLAAGVLQGASVRGPLERHLVALHVHGSMSEGYGTMTSHLEEALNSGYDGVWFTDHMGRQDTWVYPLEIGLDGNANGPILPAPLLTPSCELVLGGQAPSLLTTSYLSASPMVGTEHLQVHVDASVIGSVSYSSATLAFKGRDRVHRLPLLTLPQFAGWVRLRSLQGDAGFVIRITLSGEPNGTAEGKNRILELVPPNFTAPPVAPGVVRLPAPPLPIDQWVHLSAEPHQYVSLFPGGTLDMSMLSTEIVFYGRGSGDMVLDLDHLTISRLGPSGAALYAGARSLLDAMPPSPLFTHVGAEIEGPFDQAIMSISSRDHMTALFPGTTPAFFPFTAGTPEALNYPQSGIDLIHQHGGAAILAHIFSASQSQGFTLRGSPAQQLADRIYQNAAWGADGIEVGYPHRGRPMEDLVRVWDQLSEDQVYITGIGSSDIHDMMPWVEWPNRWGTWIVGTDDSSASLIDAVKAGDCFFGDPFRLDPDGLLYIEDSHGGFQMGDVVPVAPGDQDFRVEVIGAASTGGQLVMFINGVEVDRRLVAGGGSKSYVETQWVSDGDWVRVELRDSQDRPYAMTNPIYFIGAGQTPPSHRAP